MTPTSGADRAAFSRRRLLARGATLSGGALASSMLAHPSAAGAQRSGISLVRSGRPVITHGVQSGDVSARSAVVWARADRPGRLVVETGASESFRLPRRFAGLVVTEESDFTGQIELRGLPSGQDIFYRVRFESLADPRAGSETVTGHLRTAPSRTDDISFVWSGDTAGQGGASTPTSAA